MELKHLIALHITDKADIEEAMECCRLLLVCHSNSMTLGDLLPKALSCINEQTTSTNQSLPFGVIFRAKLYRWATCVGSAAYRVSDDSL